MEGFDKEAFKSALSGAAVEAEPEVVKEPVETGALQIEIVEDEPDKNVLDDYDETQLISDFKSKIGYEGDIEGSGLDAIAFAANKQIEKYKTIAEDERVKDFLNFLDAGGTKEQFLEAQPSNVYASVELDEENTELTERVVQEVLIELRNYDDQNEIIEFIDNLKDSGKLFEFAEKQLPKLQQKEKQENQQRKEAIEREVANTKVETQKYYSSISEAFDKNNLVGIAPDSNWATVKKLSVPDEKGKIAIHDLLDNLNPSEVATMNYAVYCLKNNIPYTFKPSGKVGTVTKPIHQILDRGKAEIKVPQTQGAFGTAMKQKLANIN